MKPQTNTAIRMIVTLVLVAGGAIAPHYVTTANALAILAAASPLFLGALALSNLFHVPGKVVKVLQTLVAAVDTAKTAIPAPAMAAAKKIAGRAVVILAIVLPLGALAGVASLATACNASSAQVNTTIADGAKVGVCIVTTLLAGGDPLACANATEQLVVGVVNDVTAKAADAGAGALELAPAQRSHFEAERARMVTILAQKRSAK